MSMAIKVVHCGRLYFKIVFEELTFVFGWLSVKSLLAMLTAFLQCQFSEATTESLRILCMVPSQADDKSCLLETGRKQDWTEGFIS